MFNSNTNTFTHIPTNLEILNLIHDNNIPSEIEIKEGEILTCENSDIAFHSEFIINSLDKTNLKNITHKSPYDTSNSWKPKPIKMMYLLTKQINEGVINLLKQPIPRFLAVSITGMGGTELEPNVPIYQETFLKLKELIDNGFDVSDVIIRIDPLYPGINTPDINYGLLETLIKAIHKLGITQIYTSMFDIYKSTNSKIKQKLDMSAYKDGIYRDNVLHANESYLRDIFTKVDNMIYEIGGGKIAHILCGEISEIIPEHSIKVGCLNLARIEQTLHSKIIGIKDRNIGDKNVQRGSCLCVITTKEKKVKRQALTESHHCKHNCLGCYINKNSNEI